MCWLCVSSIAVFLRLILTCIVYDVGALCSCHSSRVSVGTLCQSQPSKQSRVFAIMPRLPLSLLWFFVHLQFCHHRCHLLPTAQLLNSFVTSHPPFRFSVELLPPWMLGTRVGEALKPGPTRFAIINPTSIISKISQFDVLANQCQIDIVCASETSATSKAQKLFSRTSNRVPL